MGKSWRKRYGGSNRKIGKEGEKERGGDRGEIERIKKQRNRDRQR